MRVRYLNANHARQACKNLNFDVRCSLIRKSHGLDKLKPGAPLFSSLFATSHSAQRDQCSKLIMPPSFKAAALVTAPIFKRASSVQEQMEQKNLVSSPLESLRVPTFVVSSLPFPHLSFAHTGGAQPGPV